MPASLPSVVFPTTKEASLSVVGRVHDELDIELVDLESDVQSFIWMAAEVFGDPDTDPADQICTGFIVNNSYHVALLVPNPERPGEFYLVDFNRRDPSSGITDVPGFLRRPNGPSPPGHLERVDCSRRRENELAAELQLLPLQLHFFRQGDIGLGETANDDNTLRGASGSTRCLENSRVLASELRRRSFAWSGQRRRTGPFQPRGHRAISVEPNVSTPAGPIVAAPTPLQHHRVAGVPRRLA